MPKKSIDVWNMFIPLIYEKVEFSWKHCFKYLKHRIKLLKFDKAIMEGSPSFEVLWQMAEFIRLAEKIFFVPNTQSGILYSSSSYNIGQSGFKVNDPDKGVKITVKLIHDSHQVLLEVENTKGGSGKTTLSFTENNWDCRHNIYDELMLDQVIDCINFRIMELFWTCYSKRSNSTNW